MEAIEVAKTIKKAILAIRDERLQLPNLAEEKANKTAEYEKVLSKTIIQLRHGKEIEFEGETIKDPPATVLEKIARGMVFQEAINRDMAEMAYKNCIVNIECLKAALNGYQSIYRHLDET